MTAYDMRISDWSSDVCSSDLAAAISERGAKDAIWPRAVTVALALELAVLVTLALGWHLAGDEADATAHYLYPLIGAAGIAMGIQSVTVGRLGVAGVATTYVTGTLTSSAVRLVGRLRASGRSEEHTSELQSLMRISYAVFCL